MNNTTVVYQETPTQIIAAAIVCALTGGTPLIHSESANLDSGNIISTFNFKQSTKQYTGSLEELWKDLVDDVPPPQLLLNIDSNNIDGEALILWLKTQNWWTKPNALEWISLLLEEPPGPKTIAEGIRKIQLAQMLSFLHTPEPRWWEAEFAGTTALCANLQFDLSVAKALFNEVEHDVILFYTDVPRGDDLTREWTVLTRPGSSYNAALMLEPVGGTGDERVAHYIEQLHPLYQKTILG